MKGYLVGGGEGELEMLQVSERRKRGRPALAPIEYVLPRCERLLGYFENYWAEVAWDLQRARSLPQIRSALRRASHTDWEMELFVLEEAKTGTAEELALKRAELLKWETQLRSELQDEPEISRKLEQAERAATQFPTNPKIQDLQQRAQRNADYVLKRIAKLNVRVDQLRTELRRREAHFSQSEMLEFLQSDRYSFIPLNIAKAMAGVPRITWRQSAARLAKVEVSHPHEAEYKRFQMFAAAFGPKVPKHAESAIERVQGFLSRKSSRDFAIERLRKDWYFVKVGIERAFTDAIPKSAVPFRAFQAYRSRANAPQPGDLLLAEDEAL
jgi:hypothetical protein